MANTGRSNLPSFPTTPAIHCRVDTQNERYKGLDVPSVLQRNTRKAVPNLGKSWSTRGGIFWWLLIFRDWRKKKAKTSRRREDTIQSSIRRENALSQSNGMSSRVLGGTPRQWAWKSETNTWAGMWWSGYNRSNAAPCDQGQTTAHLPCFLVFLTTKQR